MGRFFGTSGIRGLIDKHLKPDFCVKIGLAAAKFFGEEANIIIGYDHRPQSRIVASAVISGLLAGGVNVLDAEIIPTPAVLYGLKEMKLDGAVVVTGSHTTPEITGILFFKRDTSELSKEEEDIFEKILIEENFNRVPWNRVGRLEYINIIDIYIESVLSLIDLGKVEGRKVVVDPGNGAASGILKFILIEAGLVVQAINDYLDPTFPGRGAFPRVDVLNDLCRVTKAVKADLGVGTDGDGDRALFCDENGTAYWGDVSGAIFARGVVRKGHKRVVVTINTSHIVKWAVEKEGGEVIFSRVGPPAIADTMKKYNAYYGIEESGKYLWSDAIYYGDAALATLRMLEILEEEEKTFSELVSELPKFHLKKVAISCPDEIKKKVLEKSINELKRILPNRYEITEVIDIDGLKIIFNDNSWLLLRPSGTEPVFRVFAESQDPQLAQELIEIGEKVVKKLIEQEK
ncbi:MAG: hypothetical protein ACTSX9_07420 [Candidatus Njordarchaeales archaeon]